MQNTELMKPEPAPLAVQGPGPLNPERLIEMAITNKVEVGTMERLLAMRTQVKAELAQEGFTAALAAFQSECPAISKPQSVTNRDGSHRYNFAPLDHIVAETKDLRERHGFSFAFDSTTTGNMVKAICTVTHFLGHSRASTFEAPTDAAPGMNKMQAYASALSYAKRYAYIGAFGIVTTDRDDDANSTVPDNSARAKLARLKAQREQLAEEEREPITHNGPEAGDRPAVTDVPETLDGAFRDLLTIISEAPDAAELTKTINQANSLDATAKIKAAKRAINTRAATLRLKYNPETAAFEPK